MKNSIYWTRAASESSSYTNMDYLTFIDYIIDYYFINNYLILFLI